jgi:HPt (histidine-containing phosphotransfer) domain-containing protein
LSDDFLKAATKEIQEELDTLQQILGNCNNDIDIFNNGKEIQMHLHKIKGLAPMMGQKDIGEIAKLTDAVVRHVIANGALEETLKNLLESNNVMRAIFCDKYNEDLNEYKEKIKETFANVLK